MKKIIAFLFFAAVALQGIGQEGTVFRDLAFDRALAAAKAEGKYLFVDCYTEWCGPCKMMTRDVFPTREVGDYFNPKYVCVKYDMEKGEGPALSARFGVNVFPTFLILDGDGELLHRFAGGGRGQEFIARVEESFDPDKAVAALDRRFRAGERTPEFLNHYLEVLEKSYAPGQDKVSAALMALVPDDEKISEKYWTKIYSDLNHAPVGSECERFLEANKAAFDALIGKDKVDSAIYFKYLNYYGAVLVFDMPMPADPVRLNPDLDVAGIDELIVMDAAMFAGTGSDIDALLGLFAGKAEKIKPSMAQIVAAMDKIIVKKGSDGQQQRWKELSAPHRKPAGA